MQELYPNLRIYQHNLHENAHYALFGLREQYFARERGHKHRQKISVKIIYTSPNGVMNCNFYLEYLYGLNQKPSI